MPGVPLHARTVRLSARLWDAVDDLAIEDGVSSAEIVREAVVRLLERVELEKDRARSRHPEDDKRN